MENPIILIIIVVLSLTVLFAQLRLFSIDNTLKKMHRMMQIRAGIDPDDTGKDWP